MDKNQYETLDRHLKKDVSDEEINKKQSLVNMKVSLGLGGIETLFNLSKL